MKTNSKLTTIVVPLILWIIASAIGLFWFNWLTAGLIGGLAMVAYGIILACTAAAEQQTGGRYVTSILCVLLSIVLALFTLANTGFQNLSQLISSATDENGTTHFDINIAGDADVDMQVAGNVDATLTAPNLSATLNETGDGDMTVNVNESGDGNVNNNVTENDAGDVNNTITENDEGDVNNTITENDAGDVNMDVDEHGEGNIVLDVDENDAGDVVMDVDENDEGDLYLDATENGPGDFYVDITGSIQELNITDTDGDTDPTDDPADTPTDPTIGATDKEDNPNNPDADTSVDKECNHNWKAQYDDTHHWLECPKCDETKDKEKHDLETDYNSTYHWHACEDCDYSSDKEKHDWDDGEVTKQPTATREGIRTYTCDECGATKTESIDKLEDEEPEENEDKIEAYLVYADTQYDQSSLITFQIRFKGVKSAPKHTIDSDSVSVKDINKLGSDFCFYLSGTDEFVVTYEVEITPGYTGAIFFDIEGKDIEFTGDNVIMVKPSQFPN